MTDVLIAVPARYGSSRLPGKILKNLGGKPVIQHVYETCKKTGLGEVIIATESPLVVEACAKFGANAKAVPTAFLKHLGAATNNSLLTCKATNLLSALKQF